MLIFMMSGRANQKLSLSVWGDRPERVSKRQFNRNAWAADFGQKRPHVQLARKLLTTTDQTNMEIASVQPLSRMIHGLVNTSGSATKTTKYK